MRTFDPVADVEEFHRHFGINYEGKPRVLDFKATQFRLKFLREEISEFERHADAALFELDKKTRSPEFQTGDFAFNPDDLIHHMADMLDSLVDLCYVAIGTAHQQGMDFRTAWARVHEANMAKQMRPEGAALSPDDRIKLNLIKPDGWSPPDHTDLVGDNIYSGA